jgi:hypothetical protein
LYYDIAMKPIWLLLLLLVITAPRSSARAVCSHPYYPSAAGATWRYQISGALSQQYTQKILSNNGSSFVMQNTFNDLSTKTTIGCNPDGSLSQNQYSDVSGSNVNARVQTLSSSGVAFPAPNRWVVGATWTYAYTIRMTSSAGGQTITSQGSVTITNKLLASERVSVAAGSFDTLKMQTTIAMDLNANMAGQRVPIRNTSTGLSWLARNVGMVKSRSEAANSSTELISFTRR